MRALKTTIYNNKNVYMFSFEMRAKLAPRNTDKSALLDLMNALLSCSHCYQCSHVRSEVDSISLIYENRV